MSASTSSSAPAGNGVSTQAPSAPAPAGSSHASTTSNSSILGNVDRQQQQQQAPQEHANMHFDTQTNKWMYENTETGQEFEWNEVANAWVPVADEEELKKQQAAYSVAGVDEEAPTNVILARDRKKLKRKAGADGDDPESSKAAAAAAAKKKASKGPRNTAIYITGLPLDCTPEEVSSVFSKAGLILLDADGQPKIKLYTDTATGKRNGDGLIVYYKEESMTLAQNLFDEAPLRLGDSQNMKVTKAQWGHKESSKAAGGDDGNAGDASAPAKKKGKSNAEAQKMQRRAEKLQKEAADYDPSYDEKDTGLAAVGVTGAQQQAGTGAKAAGGRVVVLAHVFTLEELEEDASLLLDLKEDVRDECEALGKVTNVVLYDKEPDGIVTIKFSDPISAQACVLKNNNRFFGGRQLKAWIYDGKTRYHKGGAGDSLAVEGETEDDAEKRRLEEFGKWLEEDGA